MPSMARRFMRDSALHFFVPSFIYAHTRALVAIGRFPSLLYTVKIIVVKLAQPPSTLLMGSARNTPHTPRPRRGRM